MAFLCAACRLLTRKTNTHTHARTHTHANTHTHTQAEAGAPPPAYQVGWPGITYAIAFAIVTAHSFAVPVMLYNDKLRRQENEDEEVTKRRADEAAKPNSQQEVDGPDDDHSIRLGASL